jgi:hypothetical protein
VRVCEGLRPGTAGGRAQVDLVLQKHEGAEGVTRVLAQLPEP